MVGSRAGQCPALMPAWPAGTASFLPKDESLAPERLQCWDEEWPHCHLAGMEVQAPSPGSSAPLWFRGVGVIKDSLQTMERRNTCFPSTLSG